MTTTGIGAIGAVCDTTKIPVFNSLFIAGTKTQPTSMPSDSPSRAPSKGPTVVKPEVMTSSVIGFVSIVVLIFFLRFYPNLISRYFEKPKKLSNHRYDVLVMIDNDHDAILENISHEDIAFFRRTEIKQRGDTLYWVINDTPIALEKRFEVKFFDKYELLNDSIIKRAADDKLNDAAAPNLKARQKSLLFDKVPMQKGMIIRVKLKDDKSSKDNRAYNSEFHSFAGTTFSGKRPRPSTHSSGSGRPSDHVITHFVINNSSISERIKLAPLEKYHLKSPRTQISTPQSLGSVSVDVSGDNRTHIKSALKRAEESQSSDFDHRRASGFKFKDMSSKSEIEEEPREHESSSGSERPSDEYNYGDELEDDELISIRSSDLYEYGDGDGDEKEEITPSKRGEESWDFPSENGYKHNDQSWELQESARLRRGSWRQESKEDENLNNRVRRGPPEVKRQLFLVKDSGHQNCSKIIASLD